MTCGFSKRFASTLQATPQSSQIRLLVEQFVAFRRSSIPSRNFRGAPVLPGPATKALGRAGVLGTLGAGITEWGVIAACVAECSGR